jgi:hypothetical protein
MQDTGVSQEIARLRQEIAATQAFIRRHRCRITALHESGDPSGREQAELDEMVEAHGFMVARLTRLESCRRAL